MIDSALYLFEDASRSDCQSLEAWLPYDAKIKRFSTDGFVSDFDYYSSDPNDNGVQYLFNKDVWIKKVTYQKQIVAYLILFLFDKKFLVNPIVVNPFVQNNGHGTAILQTLLHWCNQTDAVSEFRVGCMAGNVYCIKMLTKLGFLKVGTSKNKNFIYYRYPFETPSPYSKT